LALALGLGLGAGAGWAQEKGVDRPRDAGHEAPAGEGHEGSAKDGREAPDREAAGREARGGERAQRLEPGVLKLTSQDLDKVKQALIQRGYGFKRAGEKQELGVLEVVGLFQRDHGLRDAGGLDLATLHALGFDAVVAIAPEVKGADLARSQGATGATERPAGLPKDASVVGQGKDPLGAIVLGPTQIEEIQERLKDEGYFRGDTDGAFSKDLVAAIRKFQQANGVKESKSIVDLATLASFPSVHIEVKVPEKAEKQGEKEGEGR
ncbi:MAG TPA: peptidoglycan-binding domain-containing protein, partial [Planctomycetota bacterium]|nr:peptidoglycan-binding domain-containing protein [Planctomycetota bacterium]